MNETNVCALLVGRQGSKGFPKKNTTIVLGKHLMEYPILAAKGSKYIDKIYVSTDSEKIKEIGNIHGCSIIDRPSKLCTDDARCEDVFNHGYREILKNNDVDILVLLMCNAPMITSEMIDTGIEVLIEHPEYDSAISVSRYNMFSPIRARKIKENGLLEPFVNFGCMENNKKFNSNRDSQGDCWFADMGVSIVRKRCLENIENGILPQKWMGNVIYPLRQEGGFDIDYEWEIPMVERWLLVNGRNKR